ncbi:Metallo-dependent phosphatase [Athelia psychrophila]|uniref:Metallo-dependent phosphatase n=1 Tax=Athelia psychrophila TaxID=1759441 RepID=A0A165ZK83_9AGAM|nr:Metallo-dependent phosphatase [Fibularhizoctonia sp. CBS 109695]
MSSLHILHYNDVYHVIPNGELHPLLQFYTTLRSHKKEQTLQLFSGDAFGGSRLSTMTEGMIMVDVLKELKPHASVIGNHELDHGYERMDLLLRESSAAGQPWLMANVKGSLDNKFPSNAAFQRHLVVERAGVRIGIVGLQDQDSYDCSQTHWVNAKLLLDDMVQVGMECSEYLRNEEKCDIVIGITHASLSSDLTVARGLNALTPEAQDALNKAAKESSNTKSFSQTPGIDIIFGGHDHFYYISNGIKSWANRHGKSGREDEGEDVLIVKSGTNFYDLSELNLVLEDTAKGSVRRKVIRDIKGEHFDTKVQKADDDVADIMKQIIDQAPKGEDVIIGIFDQPFETSEKIMRLGESMVGNWVADVIRPFYNSHPDVGRTDGVMIGSGSIRDWPSEKGPRDLGGMMELLPFAGEVVVLSLKGADIWAAMNHSLSLWPGPAGRFSVISGFRVTWDSRRKSNDRLTSVWMLNDDEIADLASNPVETIEDTRGTRVLNDADGDSYKVATLSYMAKGGDGFGDILKEDPVTGRCRPIVKEEAGYRLDAIMEKFLKDRLQAAENIPSVIYDPYTKSILQEFANGYGQEPGNDYLQSSNIISSQSIGEWAKLRPGPKPAPTYHLYKDGRLLDEGRLQKQPIVSTFFTWLAGQ